jgi:hypothetical protein
MTDLKNGQQILQSQTPSTTFTNFSLCLDEQVAYLWTS